MRRITMKEGITYLKKISKKAMLVATRQGKIFHFNLKNCKYKKILEIGPSIQKGNAVWNITRIRNSFLIIFSDWWVCKIS